MTGTLDRCPEEAPPLSMLLLCLAPGSPERSSVADIVAHFGRRAIGAVLFFFALLNLLPLPPGATTVLGLPLLILAPQVALRVKRPWLPEFVARRTVSRSMLASLCRRAAPSVARIERLTRPRLSFMLARPGEIAIGSVCALLAFVIILPIPLGNMLPSLAVAVLSLSLVQRDGLLAIAGFILFAASLVVLMLSAELVWVALRRLFDILDRTSSFRR